MSFITPWSGQLEEGTYSVEMPSNVVVGSDTYNFVQWENTDTNPTRTINLTSDLSILATYQLQVITAIEIHAFYEGQEVSAQGIIVETGYQFTTPETVDVTAGTYTIQLTYQDQTKETTVQIVEGQTVRVDEQFIAPTPIPPLVIATIIGVPVAGIILWKILQ